MDLATLAAHTATTGIVSPGVMPYLLMASRPLAITVTAYYAIKAAIFLAAGTVAMCTKDKDRREACLKLVEMVCRGWPFPPWRPRLPGPQP